MDRRIRKTREAIYSAFASLVVERGYDRTTIEDILSAADVARSTFYAHFAGKAAVLQHGFDRLGAELDALQGPPSDFLEPLLAHARRHAGLYASLQASGGDTLADAAFMAIVLRRLRLDHDLHRAMAAGALVAGLRHWLASGALDDGAELAARFRAMVPGLNEKAPPKSGA